MSKKHLLSAINLGLHARAATKLAQLCQKFDASVTYRLNDKSADASSIMGLNVTCW